MRVEVVTRGVRHAIPAGQVRAAALAAMRATRCPRNAQLEVALIDDAAIARINRRFLGHKGVTDVISFPAGGAPGGPGIGEIVISMDRARAQARDAGWSVRREVALLVVHGVLHLRGYEDRTPRQAAQMRRRERAILAKIFPAGR
jgi:rRNA maturation RNase YbeY